MLQQDAGAVRAAAAGGQRGAGQGEAVGPGREAAPDPLRRGVSPAGRRFGGAGPGTAAGGRAGAGGENAVAAPVGHGPPGLGPHQPGVQHVPRNHAGAAGVYRYRQADGLRLSAGQVAGGRAGGGAGKRKRGDSVRKERLIDVYKSGL